MIVAIRAEIRQKIRPSPLREHIDRILQVGLTRLHVSPSGLDRVVPGQLSPSSCASTPYRSMNGPERPCQMRSSLPALPSTRPPPGPPLSHAPRVPPPGPSASILVSAHGRFRMYKTYNRGLSESRPTARPAMEPAPAFPLHAIVRLYRDSCISDQEICFMSAELVPLSTYPAPPPFPPSAHPR